MLETSIINWKMKEFPARCEDFPHKMVSCRNLSFDRESIKVRAWLERDLKLLDNSLRFISKKSKDWGKAEIEEGFKFFRGRERNSWRWGQRHERRKFSQYLLFGTSNDQEILLIITEVLMPEVQHSNVWIKLIQGGFWWFEKAEIQLKERAGWPLPSEIFGKFERKWLLKNSKWKISNRKTSEVLLISNVLSKEEKEKISVL